MSDKDTFFNMNIQYEAQIVLYRHHYQVTMQAEVHSIASTVQNVIRLDFSNVVCNYWLIPICSCNMYHLAPSHDKQFLTLKQAVAVRAILNINNCFSTS